MAEPRRLFVSYSRRDAPMVEGVGAQLRSFGQELWMDEELSGGQPWWDTILARIRDCDCFVFAQSRASCRSVACNRELEYAHALGKPILPVLVGEPLPDELLPPALAETQRVAAGTTPEAVAHLARALLNLPLPPPLPEPLPAPPPVPISYMTELSTRLEQPELSLRDQRELLAELRQSLADEAEADAAVELLKRLRARGDVIQSIAADVDELLARAPAPAGPAGGAVAPAPAPPPPAPAPAPRKRSRIVTALAVVGAVLLVLLVIGFLAGEDQDGPSTTSTTEVASTGTDEPTDELTDDEVLEAYFSDRFARCQEGRTAEAPNCQVVLDPVAQQEWLSRHGYLDCREAGSSPEECAAVLPDS